MNICVGNLAGDITAGDLREVFESFGRVENAGVMRRGRGSASRLLGFVDMPARSEGLCAILGVHGRSLGGRMITVDEVRPTELVSGACHTRCRCRCER